MVLDVVALVTSIGSWRRERLTCPGTLHHVMNRGMNGETILPGDEDKEIFLEHLSKSAFYLSSLQPLAPCLV
jgi:hypothetical protein